MKAQSYLTKNGLRIFNEILKFVESKNVSEEIDSLQLSMLAHAFDQHDEAAKEMTKTGGLYQVTKTGYSQVTAAFTVWKQTGEYITKNADKFGINPNAREKLKSFSKEQEKPKSGMAALRKLG